MMTNGRLFSLTERSLGFFGGIVSYRRVFNEVCEKDVPRLEEIVKEAMRDPLGRGSLNDFDCTLITKDKKDLHEILFCCAGFCRCSAGVYFRGG